MAPHATEHERKTRRKRSHSSSKNTKPRSSSRKPRPSPPIAPMESYLQDYAPPVQASPTHHASPQESYFATAVRSPPIPHGPHGYPASPPQHPLYGQVPQYPSISEQLFGSAPLQQPVTPYIARTTPRFASPPPHKPRDEGPFKEQWGQLDRMAAQSYTNLRDTAGKGVTSFTAHYIERPTAAVAMKSMQTLCRGAALYDNISSKFDAVIGSIDDERFSGKEQDLIIEDVQQQDGSSRTSPPLSEARGQAPNNTYSSLEKERGSNHFAKVWLYSNSRLPPHLPPFKVYIPTYPLLCLAATYSEKAYTPPGSKKSDESEAHIPADWKRGTKAMVLKSIPVEELNTIVFAVRGSQSFMDWAVNYSSDPHSPQGFLDDPANLCHAGFLYVAKKMIKPVAERLRVLLEENPARSNCSLLITGHSAGGAVAALLYAHMMSTKVESDLNFLTGFFKRVHCVTFGAPPVSLRPLKKPEDKRHRKSLFYGFINEGDPIPRADKSVLRSLLRLYASPAPAAASNLMSKLSPSQTPPSSSPPKPKPKYGLAPRLTKPSKSSLQTSTSNTSSLPAWPIPACSLSPAGRLVVLRQKPGSRCEDDIEAVTVDDESLRKVVYGDVMKHQMTVYKKRIDEVAVRAVTAKEC